MKKYIYLIFLIIITPWKSPERVGFYDPNPLACPVTKLVIPEKIVASHNEDVLLKLTSGKQGRWEVAQGGESVQLFFEENTVIQRFQISALSQDEDKKNIPIRFDWTPWDLTWRMHSRHFLVFPDGRPKCFFLGYKALLPGNVAVRKITLMFPPRLLVTSLRFSDKASEQKMVNCPMPELEDKINKAYRDCIQSPEDEKKISTFIKLLKQSMYKYDCRADFSYEPIPAWYLCDDRDVENWFDLLTSLQNIEAKKLLGSELFRSTLDGYIAEIYWEQSIETEKRLLNPGKPIKHNTSIRSKFAITDEYKGWLYDRCHLDLTFEGTSTLKPSENIIYSPKNLSDQNVKTAWIEGSDGYGIGEELIIKNQDLYFRGFLIVNGYCKNKELWEKNSRVKTLGIYKDGEPIYEINLKDSMEIQEVIFAVNKLNKNDKLRIKILEVYAGTQYKDTAISELYLLQVW